MKRAQHKDPPPASPLEKAVKAAHVEVANVKVLHTKMNKDLVDVKQIEMRLREKIQHGGREPCIGCWRKQKSSQTTKITSSTSGPL